MELPRSAGFRKKKAIPKALSIELLTKLLEAPDVAQASGIRDRAMMELIYGAGLRISEAAELTLNALDHEQMAIRVTGKRDKTRWIPVPAESWGWLAKYLETARPLLQKKGSDRVFLSNRGLHLRRTTFALKLQEYCRMAGLPDEISPHILRHTYAVHLLKGGADLRVVQELLGHESIATTQVYTQLDYEEVKRRYKAAHPRK